MSSSNCGTIFQIQRWSVNDGEGIRSTVFFKGCPLRCQWCANPESWNIRPELVYLVERCNGCGQCVEVCPEGVNMMSNDAKSLFNRAACTGCFKCSAVCPTGARKPMGRVTAVDDVMSVVKKDAVFYRESGGGVTFSGGEPFFQADFLRQLVRECSRLGIDTAVETSGYFQLAEVQDIIAELDTVFVDIKHMDDAKHQTLTGVGNRVILENIAAISQIHSNVVVRVPLVETVNSDDINIRAMCEYIKQQTKVRAVEILPYHDFGQTKFSGIGLTAAQFTPPDPKTLQNIKNIIDGYGIMLIEFK